jgi:hypothetical protein
VPHLLAGSAGREHGGGARRSRSEGRQGRPALREMITVQTRLKDPVIFGLKFAEEACQMDRMLSGLDLGTMASEDVCGEGGRSSGRLAEAS